MVLKKSFQVWIAVLMNTGFSCYWFMHLPEKQTICRASVVEFSNWGHISCGYLPIFLLIRRSCCGLVLTVLCLSMAVKLDTLCRRPAFCGGSVIIKCETGFHFMDRLCPWSLPLLGGFFLLQCVGGRMCVGTLCGSSCFFFLP